MIRLAKPCRGFCAFLPSAADSVVCGAELVLSCFHVRSRLQGGDLLAPVWTNGSRDAFVRLFVEVEEKRWIVEAREVLPHFVVRGAVPRRVPHHSGEERARSSEGSSGPSSELVTSAGFSSRPRLIAT